MELNYSNTMLVRAYKNFIPLNGKMNPSCFEKYLDYDLSSDYAYIVKELFNTHKGLLPLTSVYNSILSFSINGLAPDNICNNFSEYNVCIIEPFKYHLDEDYITFNILDTTIKGGINLSNEAVLVIKRDYFNSLSESKKLQLIKLYQIYFFDNNLLEAVNHVLTINECPILDLVNKSEETLEFIDNFAENNNISKLRLFYLYILKHLNKKEDILSQAKVSDEKKYYDEIKMYYRNMFYEYLLYNANLYGLKIDDSDIYYLFSMYESSKDVLKNIVTFLKDKLGYDKYCNLVTTFNIEVNNNYKTNNEIIKNNKRNML